MDDLQHFLRDLDPMDLVGRAWALQLPDCWYERLRAIEEQDGVEVALEVEYRARTLLHVLKPLKALDSAREEVLYGGIERCRDCGGGVADPGGIPWCLVCGRVIDVAAAPGRGERL